MKLPFERTYLVEERHFAVGLSAASSIQPMNSHLVAITTWLVFGIPVARFCAPFTPLEQSL